MRIKSDPKKLLVELEYYIKYYGSEFKPNQGLEVIIQVIRMYSKNGSWWRFKLTILENVFSKIR